MSSVELCTLLKNLKSYKVIEVVNSMLSNNKKAETFT